MTYSLRINVRRHYVSSAEEGRAIP
jgi:hypothetical protein